MPRVSRGVSRTTSVGWLARNWCSQCRTLRRRVLWARSRTLSSMPETYSSMASPASSAGYAATLRPKRRTTTRTPRPPRAPSRMRPGALPTASHRPRPREASMQSGSCPRKPTPRPWRSWQRRRPLLASNRTRRPTACGQASSPTSLRTTCRYRAGLRSHPTSLRVPGGVERPLMCLAQTSLLDIRLLCQELCPAFTPAAAPAASQAPCPVAMASPPVAMARPPLRLWVASVW
mmetsp:Transcript_2668/g.6585  ORF Transcript_2668/g.6585 Transcript_2668/m.6585 type:complete len:233 (-) Transcript_2668:563-1261(-)